MDQIDSYVALQLQFVKVVVIPVVTQRPLPMVQPLWRTMEIRSCSTRWVVDVPGMQVVQVSPVPQLLFINVVVHTPVVAQSSSHGPDSSSDLGYPSCFTW